MATLGRRRAYGQHFLRDHSIATKIAQAAVDGAEETGCKTLLEIGPGRGAITDPILNFVGNSKSVERVVLCEKDRNLVQEWNLKLKQAVVTQEIAKKSSKEFFMEDADFLELNEAKWLDYAPLTVASNLPYSSGTAIFTRLAKHPEKIKCMVLMFQAEVAARLRAEIGTKAWGSLSIWTQNAWDVTKLLTVAPIAFQPPPEVMSEVVVLRPRPTPRVPSAHGNPLWDILLKTSFLHRRKMLRSGLPKSGPLRNALELSKVDDTKRAEALNWQEWESLFLALLSVQKPDGKSQP
jgi:16S rRNA (adenine1518-N6/adenine1519-N6)-dimethyltransferase